MNQSTSLRLIATLTALVVSAGAQAATISMQPSAPTVGTGSGFTIDLDIDASDAPGAHPGLYGGQIVIDFNPAQLRYDGFALASGLSFFSAPVTGSAGGRQTVTLGFDNATDVGRVGTFSFTALASAGTTATVNIEDADQFFGTFVSYTPSYQPFTPNFVDTSVQVVPLPGTALLLVTAFAAVAARARRLLVSRRRV